MDYSRYIAKAQAKIAQFGREVAFELVDGEYDPISGRMLAETGQISAFGLLTAPKESAIKAGTVELGDMILLVAGADLETPPQTAGIARIGGECWRVVAVNCVMPDGTPILYKIQIRRA